MTRKKGKSYNN